MQNSRTRSCLLCCRLTLLFLGCASPAGAVQQHGGAEGLVAHQIGHILFIIGMGYLLYRVYLTRLTSPGWLEFKCFLWLIIAWNSITFVGHWMHEFVAPEKFSVLGGQIVSFSVRGFPDAFFYLTRLDHLFLVPSFVFLLLALKQWRRQA